MKKFLFTIKISILSLFCIAIFFAIFLAAKLPSIKSLKNVQLQVPLKIYSKDHRLIAEYGTKRRTPVKFENIPQDIINAFIATEDARFYSHPGVDLKGIIRAFFILITNKKKQQGGSTITMQVARNFFLSRSKTFMRKFNEIFLALKIEKRLTKDEILELYLNKIYLGKRAYGISAAAKTYYGTTLENLTLPQIAMIAGLPQAPSAKNPINNPSAAIKRRNHVLRRMLHYKYINKQEFKEAIAAPITAEYYGKTIELKAPYVAEMVRQKLLDVYGESIYQQGLTVYTTIDSRYQKTANKALTQAVLEYDQRHGYRKHITKFELPLAEDTDTLKNTINEWQKKLSKIKRSNGLIPAVVISNSRDKSHIMLENGTFHDINFEYIKWARPVLNNKYLGKFPTKPSKVMQPGDVIYVKEIKPNIYSLVQMPIAEGALVSIEPKTGALLSLVGGFDFYGKSSFNRVMQAERQPGSNFKPFIYSTALEKGYTAATIINDAPFVEEDHSGEYDWRPQNSSRRFYGPTRLKVGVTHSRNLVSIRLLKMLGLDETITFLKRFGFQKEALPKVLSLALGVGAITPLELATAYCTFANGGYKISPYIISKIVNYKGETLFEYKEKKICKENDDCTEVERKNSPKKILSSQTAYIMYSILQDAIQFGTGRRAKVLKRKDIAGKTGSTNDHYDAWYSGFNKNIVTTTWIGFDEPKNLGEYAVKAALPMWIYYMKEVLKTIPEEIPEQPPGIVTVKIDPLTGLLARQNQKNAIYEVFTEETVPTDVAPKVYDYLSNDNDLEDKENDDSCGIESLF